MATQNLQSVVIAKSIHSEAQKQSRSWQLPILILLIFLVAWMSKPQQRDQESIAATRQIIQSAAANDSFWKNQ
jgi:hypothetical protein